MTKYDERFVALGLILLTLTGSYFVFFNNNEEYVQTKLSIPVVQWYDEILYKITPDGTAYLRWGKDIDSQAWDEVEVLESQILMYDVAKKPELATPIDKQLKQLMDWSGDYDNNGFKDWSKGQNDDLNNGRLAFVFPYACYIFEKNKNTEMTKKCKDIYIPFAESLAKDMSQTSNYKEYISINGKNNACFYGGNIGDTYCIPHNRANYRTRFYMYLYLIDKNEQWKTITQKTVQRFTDACTVKTATIDGNNVEYCFWNHYNRDGAWEKDWCAYSLTLLLGSDARGSAEFMCSGGAGFGYSNWEIAMLVDAYEQGYITKSQLDLYHNSMIAMMVKNGKARDYASPLINRYVDYPEPDQYLNRFYETGGLSSWTRIAIKDVTLVPQFERILEIDYLTGKLNGDFYNRQYECTTDPRINNGQICYGNYRVKPSQILLGLANLKRFDVE